MPQRLVEEDQKPQRMQGFAPVSRSEETDVASLTTQKRAQTSCNRKRQFTIPTWIQILATLVLLGCCFVTLDRTASYPEGMLPDFVSRMRMIAAVEVVPWVVGICLGNTAFLRNHPLRKGCLTSAFMGSVVWTLLMIYCVKCDNLWLVAGVFLTLVGTGYAHYRSFYRWCKKSER